MLTREDIILNAPRFSESIVLSPLFVLAKVINRNTFIFTFSFFFPWLRVWARVMAAMHIWTRSAQG